MAEDLDYGKCRAYRCPCGGLVIRRLHGTPRPCDRCGQPAAIASDGMGWTVAAVGGELPAGYEILAVIEPGSTEEDLMGIAKRVHGLIHSGMAVPKAVVEALKPLPADSVRGITSNMPGASWPDDVSLGLVEPARDEPTHKPQGFLFD